MRWKNFGETSTQEGHKLYFSGREDKYEQGIGFLVHTDSVSSVLGCRPVSSRLINIYLRATPVNISIIQVYSPTTSYGDDEVENGYNQLQEVLDQVPKKDVLIVQGDWNTKVGKDTWIEWKNTCRICCNEKSNESSLRLLEFANNNNLILANTFGPHKASRRWTWHSPDDKHHNQIDYIMIRKRFHSSVNIARTRSLPGADIGSNHDLTMMSFWIHLMKVFKKGSTRIRFNLNELKDPQIAESFRAMIGGKYAPLITLDRDQTDMDSLINTFNTAVTDTAYEILGKHLPVKKLGVASGALDACDKRRELK